VAQVVDQVQAAEEANPWHLVMIAGQVLFVAGLGGLYGYERATNARLRRRLATLSAARTDGAGATTGEQARPASVVPIGQPHPNPSRVGTADPARGREPVLASTPSPREGGEAAAA